MGLSYLKLFFSFREEIELLSMEERGRLVTAMLEYAETGKLPGDSLVGNERFLFTVCRQRIDRDIESYNRQVEAGRANGLKGGRPKKTPRVILETQKTQEEDKDQDQEKEDDEAKEQGEGEEKAGGAEAAAEAPTLKEVVDFCDREAPSVDGERFWNYYQAVGWRVGGRRIVDWRAKLREWERGNQTGEHLQRCSGPPEKNPALNYTQREIKDPEAYNNSCFVWFDDWKNGRGGGG